MGAMLNPALGAYAVTSSNTTNIAITTRSLWVGGAGDLTVLMQDGGSATFAGVPAGTLLPIRVNRVDETGTSATSILALY